jgi:hypothetical protein
LCTFDVLPAANHAAVGCAPFGCCCCCNFLLFVVVPHFALACHLFQVLFMNHDRDDDTLFSFLPNNSNILRQARVPCFIDHIKLVSFFFFFFII